MKRQISAGGRRAARPYQYLRRKLKWLGIDFEHLGRLLKPSIDKTCVSRRMNGHTRWRLDEMYQIMDIIREPYDRLHIVFPPDGVNTEKDIA